MNSVSPTDAVPEIFRLIYPNGIPPTITHESAYLSFILTFCAIEALAGYRYGPRAKKRQRFEDFVGGYFPQQYKNVSGNLWSLRNSMVHAFSTSHFLVTHNHPELHFVKKSPHALLDALSFYEDMKLAAEKYFNEMKASSQVQITFADYLNSESGGVRVQPGPLGIAVTGAI